MLLYEFWYIVLINKKLVCGGPRGWMDPMSASEAICSIVVVPPSSTLSRDVPDFRSFTSILDRLHGVHPKKYVHCLWFVLFGCGSALVDFTHILQDYLTSTGAVERLPQCQWSNPEEYGQKDPTNPTGSHNITTTKQSTTKPCTCLFVFLLKTKNFHDGKVFVSACFSLWQPSLPSVIASSLWQLLGFNVYGRDHFGYGLSQWETTLQYNIASHWLSP